MDQERPLTVLGHLEELRRRLVISSAAVLVASAASFSQVERIIEWLREPASSRIHHFAFFSPTEAFLAHVKVALICGFVLAVPVILSQLWAFLRSGLTPKERSSGLVFVLCGSACFLVGIAFGYGILLPTSLTFLLGVGRDYLEPVISIDRYLSFVTMLVFSCGIVFELPMVLFLLSKAGITTPEWLRQQRPYAILCLVILAAVITPTTDVVTLLLMVVPLILLYEASIFICKATSVSHQKK